MKKQARHKVHEARTKETKNKAFPLLWDIYQDILFLSISFYCISWDFMG
jgi:hypothetical protein